MDNELLSAKIAAIEAKALWPEGGRDDEPDGLTFHVSLLWPGAGLARVERFARRRLSLSQGSAIACDRPSSPRSDQALVRMLTGRSYPPGNRSVRLSRRRLSQTMGATARCRGSLRPSPRAPGDGERTACLRPIASGTSHEKTHDGTIVTDKVNEMWGTDMSQTVTIEEGQA